MKPKRTKAKEDTYTYLRRIVTELDNIQACLLKEGGYYSVRALAAARKGLVEAGHFALFLNHCTVIREDFPGYAAPEPDLECEYEGDGLCTNKRGSCGFCVDHCPCTASPGDHHRPWKGEFHDVS
jgi:hypothetical protein